MIATNVSLETARSLPSPLRMAQTAMQLPEVQDMLRRLSGYKLGIFMPHMHDEKTGEFQLLPDDVMQVESGLEVSFQPAEDIANREGHFLPVGWFWRASGPMVVTACEMARDDEDDGGTTSIKHKMTL